MGIYGSRHRDVEYQIVYKNESVPDPTKWDLVDCFEHGGFAILKLRYPDCKNHNGMKILVYEAKFVDLVKQKNLDPHFGDEKENYVYPIARFTPDDKGWKYAIRFVEKLTNHNLMDA